MALTTRGPITYPTGFLEYFQSSVLGGISLSVPLMKSERDFLTTSSVPQSSEKFLIDNPSKRHSFLFCSSL
jgi:hypothetical protein